jgi:hypothetical protein
VSDKQGHWGYLGADLHGAGDLAVPKDDAAGLSLEASLRDDGNLHCPERHELFRQVEHRGGVAAALAKALQVTGIDTFLA